jgi:hypothetical protein
MLTFVVVAACSANAAQPSPGDLLAPNATDPLATFWLPTPTGGAAGSGAASTPAAGTTPGALPGAPLDDDPSQPPNVGGTPALTTPGAPAGTGLSADLPPVVAVARAWLGQQLGTVEANVVLQNVERVSWPDTCLGLGTASQGCAQVATPGYRIIFYANGQTYEVRVDDAGRTLRVVEGGKG